MYSSLSTSITNGATLSRRLYGRLTFIRIHRWTLLSDTIHLAMFALATRAVVLIPDLIIQPSNTVRVLTMSVLTLHRAARLLHLLQLLPHLLQTLLEAFDHRLESLDPFVVHFNPVLIFNGVLSDVRFVTGHDAPSRTVTTTQLSAELRALLTTTALDPESKIDLRNLLALLETALNFGQEEDVVRDPRDIITIVA